MPEAMQSQGLGTACRLLLEHRGAVRKNEEQNRTKKRTKNPKRTKKTKRQALPPRGTGFLLGLSLSRLGRYFRSQMARSSTVQKKRQAPQRVGACGYLPVLVRLVHHGSLRGAIVGVLGRKHGASASPRLAGISRRPNVWWPKVEQKNNFGFALQTSMNPPVHSVTSTHRCRGSRGVA